MARERRIIDGKRYDLSSMIDLGYSTREDGGKRTVRALYGPRSKRLILEHYSIWDRGDSHHVGTAYTVYEPDHPDYPFIWESIQKDGVQLPDSLPIKGLVG